MIIESVEKLNVPSYYTINDVKVVSANSIVLVGSYIDPNEPNQNMKAWFGIYEDNRLVSQFDFGGEYLFQQDKLMVFTNTEFITIEYQVVFSML